MASNDEQFESYLREFEPRRPRALEPKRESGPAWRRLAAAAGVMIALGTSLWVVFHPPEKRELQTETAEAPGAARESLSVVTLTKLAETNPSQLDAELASASRQLLPDFRSEKSTLRVLAKE
jgi:hypothetical protein